MLVSLGLRILYCVAFAVPVCAVVGSSTLTTLMVIASLIPALCCIRDKALRVSLISPHSIALLLLLIFGMVSSLWALKPHEAWQLGLRMVVLCSLGYCCVAFAYRYAGLSLLRFVTFGNILALVVIVVEIMTGGYISSLLRDQSYVYSLSDLNKSANIISLSAWVTLYWLLKEKRIVFAAGFWLLVIGIFLFMDSLSAIVAFITASVIYGFLYLFPRKGFAVIFISVLVGLAAAPAVFHTVKPEAVTEQFPGLPPSSVYRLYIWEYASHKMMERPWLGWGMSGTRYIEVKPEDIRNPLFYPMPLHPHNQMLQLWFDLGAPGVVLFLVFIGCLLYAIRLSPAYSVAVVVAISYLIIGGLGYSVWHSWLISGSFLVAACIAPALFPVSRQGII